MCNSINKKVLISVMLDILNIIGYEYFINYFFNIVTLEYFAILRSKDNLYEEILCYIYLPKEGIEPSWSYLRRILNPLRLPISPLRHLIIE